MDSSDRKRSGRGTGSSESSPCASGGTTGSVDVYFKEEKKISSEKKAEIERRFKEYFAKKEGDS